MGRGLRSRSMTLSLYRHVDSATWFISHLEGLFGIAQLRMRFNRDTEAKEVLSPSFYAGLQSHLPLRLEPSVLSIAGEAIKLPGLLLGNIRVMSMKVIGNLQTVMIRISHVSGNLFETLADSHRPDIALPPISGEQTLTKQSSR